MAAAALDALQLGRGSATDFLGVSFSSLDVVGHSYGPRSHEVQDLLVRLDRTIGGCSIISTGPSARATTSSG